MGDVADAAAPDAAFVALYINGCQVRHATDPPRMTMKLLDRDGTPLRIRAAVAGASLARADAAGLAAPAATGGLGHATTCAGAAALAAR